MVTWGVTDAGTDSSDYDLTFGIETDENSLSALYTTASAQGGAHDLDTPSGRETIPVTTTGLELPAGSVTVSSADSDGLEPVTERATIGPGAATVAAEPEGPDLPDELRTVLTFRGPATVDIDDERARIEFPDPTAVTIIVQPGGDADDRMRVPGTPRGIARAVTHLGSAHRTTSPARSHPAHRDPLPAIEVGNTESIPPAIKSETPETGIELLVPNELESVFVLAPLAFYLAADLRVAAVDHPHLRTRDGRVDHDLAAVPDCQEEVGDLLRQFFYLDCLVRDTGATDATNAPILDAIDLDADHVRELDSAARLERYLAVAGEDLSDRLPEWHLSTFVDPTPGNASVLSHLLDDLSLIRLPDATELDEAALLDESLSEGFTRSTCDLDCANPSTVVKPSESGGRVTAWLAPGTPLDAFKTTRSAYLNRTDYRTRASDTFEIDLVLNDGEMAGEHDAVADIYRERAEDMPIDVSIARSLTKAELRERIESGADFLHYIGHCEPEGLQCADGYLSTTEIERSRTRSFFLNACGSYEEGLGLVEAGSVAGAATLRAVLDEHAAKVGTAFAKLLMHGFSIGRAMQLARRRIMMSTDYAVVGDGTDALVPTTAHPAVIWLEDAGEAFEVSYETVPARSVGRLHEPPFGDEPYLFGQDTERTMRARELLPILEDSSLPVIYNGEFNWSEELVTEIR
ncbi:hypothetical protein [Halococcoides cellulosivorans]|uniref:CHAT domain-containing protein n=1 Tax=Halococcoides cellulosivorans TaxID=1679096 RepID=A0A2R4X1F2_9EURY|nr:hypothetical protein [Halococcoides cellulosivorans]AWB27622.1 hypothetical protein HARCEL1_07820 [Halococcoides cellulosivorans]